MVWPFKKKIEATPGEFDPQPQTGAPAQGDWKTPKPSDPLATASVAELEKSAPRNVRALVGPMVRIIMAKLKPIIVGWGREEGARRLEFQEKFDTKAAEEWKRNEARGAATEGRAEKAEQTSLLVLDALNKVNAELAKVAGAFTPANPPPGIAELATRAGVIEGRLIRLESGAVGGGARKEREPPAPKSEVEVLRERVRELEEAQSEGERSEEGLDERGKGGEAETQGEDPLPGDVAHAVPLDPNRTLPSRSSGPKRAVAANKRQLPKPMPAGEWQDHLLAYLEVEGESGPPPVVKAIKEMARETGLFRCGTAAQSFLAKWPNSKGYTPAVLAGICERLGYVRSRESQEVVFHAKS